MPLSAALPKEQAMEPLRSLMTAFPNNRCVDCHLMQAGGLPFVSITHRVFLCTDCAAIHRSKGFDIRRLGVDVLGKSELKSLELSSFGGNVYGSERLMSNRSLECIRPSPDDLTQRREAFVDTVYCKHLFHSADASSSTHMEAEIQVFPPQKAPDNEGTSGAVRSDQTSPESSNMKKVSFSRSPEKNVIEYDHLLSEYNAVLIENAELNSRVRELESEMETLPKHSSQKSAAASGLYLSELERKIDQLELEMGYLMSDYRLLQQRNSELEEIQRFMEGNGSGIQGTVEQLQRTLDYFLVQFEAIRTPEDITAMKLKLLGEMEHNGLTNDANDSPGTLQVSRDWEHVIEDNRNLTSEMQQMVLDKETLVNKLRFYENLIGYNREEGSGADIDEGEEEGEEQETGVEDTRLDSLAQSPLKARSDELLSIEERIALEQGLESLPPGSVDDLCYSPPSPSCQPAASISPPARHHLLIESGSAHSLNVVFPVPEDDSRRSAILENELEDLRSQYLVLQSQVQSNMDAINQTVAVYDAVIAHGYTPSTMKLIDEAQKGWSTSLASVLNRVLEDQQQELLSMLEEIKSRIDEQGFTTDSLLFIRSVDEQFKTQFLQLFTSVIETQKSLFKEELMKKDSLASSKLADLQKRYDELRQVSQKEGEELLKVRKMHSQELAGIRNMYSITVQEASAPYLEEISGLQRSYLQEKRECEYLRNELIELKGNIRVYCRARPFLSFDSDDHNNLRIKCKDRHINLSTSYYGYDFDFDRCFGSESEQVSLFQEMKAYFDSVLSGYNMCIFAYGQTGTGKTYTMEGPKSDRGINYRAISYIFEKIEQDSSCNYQIFISVLEIYNETIKDLNVNKKPDQKPVMTYQEKSGIIHVDNIELTRVTSDSEAQDLIEKSCLQRSMGAHRQNPYSSRSHLIVTIHIHRIEKASKKAVPIISKLNLVDLAGSESIDKTGVTGVACTEAQHINRSLSALGNVIFALGERKKHIPYRNSKLTFVLHDSLSIGSKVIMLVTIAPGFDNLSETLNSLNFAKRCRETELSPLGKEHSESVLTKLEELRKCPISIRRDTLIMAKPTRLLLSYYNLNTYSSHLDEDAFDDQSARGRRSSGTPSPGASFVGFMGVPQHNSSPNASSQSFSYSASQSHSNPISLSFVPNHPASKTFTPKPRSSRSASAASQRPIRGPSTPAKTPAGGLPLGSASATPSKSPLFRLGNLSR